jgi:phosphate-selective porin
MTDFCIMKNSINFMMIFMRKLSVAIIFTVLSVYGYSQTQAIDSLSEVIQRIDGKTNALDERVMVNEADLGKLNKIKISGYIQAEYRDYQSALVKTNDPYSTFLIRRARLKFTYEALDGIKFVLQTDLSTGNLALKDAYAVVNIPKLKDWTLWAGQMNRPNYEVEYSSSQREVMERSRVTRAIYPGEREIGVKLEYIGSVVPLKFQLMAMNGNFTSAQPIDADTKKDLMARLVYSVKFPDAGIGIDFGANGYYGGTKLKNNPFISAVNPLMVDSVALGTYLDKHWMGGEIQIFADVLGGLAIKAEYVAGVNNYASLTGLSGTIAQLLGDPNKVRDFSGYYIYLIKNIGAKNQFVAKYDYYDPNTKAYGDASSASELNIKTTTVALQHYLNDNIRLSLQYEMPRNETNTAVPNDLKDNTLTVRVQAKF